MPCLRTYVLLSQLDMSPYLRLIRFHYHTTFAAVALGGLLTAKPSGYTMLLVLLPGLYLSFNVLLYGGIYTLNAIVDLEVDRNHPIKRHRPLPSGAIRLRSAVVFAVTMITAGLVSAWFLFNTHVFRCFVAFIALNLAYTTVAKNIAYIEIVVNAATHPLRFVMGVSLVEGRIPLALLLAFFLLAFGAAVTRRCVERSLDGWRARRVLECYSVWSLFSMRLASFAAIVLIATLDESIPPIIYRSVLAFYSLLVFGFELFSPLKSALAKLWTK
jgi:4-hydroxybenzoate polyprenyltransferase